MASLAAAMRMGNNGDMSGGGQGSTGPQQQGIQATGPEQTLRMHQAEALLRSQAEAALRLAVRTRQTSHLRLYFPPVSLPFPNGQQIKIIRLSKSATSRYISLALYYTLFRPSGVASSSGGCQFRGRWGHETSFGPA